MAMAGMSEGALVGYTGRHGVRLRLNGEGLEVRAAELRAAIEKSRIVKAGTPDLAHGDAVGLEAAAQLVGVGHGTVWRAVRAGELPAVRSGRRWLVKATDASSWAEAAGLSSIGMRQGGTYVALVERVLAQPGWTEERVSVALGVSVSRVRRWRSAGVPNLYVRRIRALLDANG